MEASDDGVCEGWREQTDILVIFVCSSLAAWFVAIFQVGLFSATVTAFTVESYQWLDETPADMLTRLQLRALLNATRDPAIDRLAPATFNVKPAFVAINTLWFASLTLALAAVVISILCKQWLYGYQRYDNFTTEESFLIHGQRYRGLQACTINTILTLRRLLCSGTSWVDQLISRERTFIPALSYYSTIYETWSSRTLVDAANSQ